MVLFRSAEIQHTTATRLNNVATAIPWDGCEFSFDFELNSVLFPVIASGDGFRRLHACRDEDQLAGFCIWDDQLLFLFIQNQIGGGIKSG